MELASAVVHSNSVVVVAFAAAAAAELDLAQQLLLTDPDSGQISKTDYDLMNCYKVA